MKKFLKISTWTILISSFFVLLGFTINVNKDRICESIDISFSSDCPYPLITETMIEEMLVDNNLRVRGQMISNLNVDEIESVICASDHVSHAKVYNNLHGGLSIKINQRLPVARIFNAEGDSFYIDDQGKPMDLSRNYSARVVGVTADFNLPQDYSIQNSRVVTGYDQIIHTIDFIRKIPFWRSQITHIHLNGFNEIELTPRVGNHKILLGKASDLEVKFENLWNFYQVCQEHQTWNKYKFLNLKYKDQIVCTKK